MANYCTSKYYLELFQCLFCVILNKTGCRSKTEQDNVNTLYDRLSVIEWTRSILEINTLNLLYTAAHAPQSNTSLIHSVGKTSQTDVFITSNLILDQLQQPPKIPGLMWYNNNFWIVVKEGERKRQGEISHFSEPNLVKNTLCDLNF